MKKIFLFVVKVLEQKWWAVMTIAMALTFVLALYLGKGQDIWFDESYSIIVAKHPINELLGLTSVDAHPPLYYLMLKLWASVFGWSELALRSLSAIFAALTVGAIALLVRYLFGLRSMLVTLPFLIIAPFWLRYGYEIRMYSLAGFIVALASLILVKATKSKNKWWWVLYASLVAVGMYTLYMTVIIWLAHFAWLVIYHRKRLFNQPWLWSFVGAVILFLPYVSTFLYQASHSALPGIGREYNMTQIGGVLSMLFAYTPEWQLGNIETIAILSVMILLIYIIDRVRGQTSVASRKSFGFMLCLALLPFVLFLVLDLIQRQAFFIPRYFAHIALFVYALVGVCVALGWKYGYKKAALSLASISLILVSWGTIQLAQFGNYNFERLYWPHPSEIRKMVDCKKSMIIADDPYVYMELMNYFQDCDLRFYSSTPLKYEGGYAWLHDSNKRASGLTDLTSKNIVHIYWSEVTNPLQFDNRYRLLSSETYQKHIINTYELTSE